MTRSRRTAAPMPDSIRQILRAKQHPARAIACPHCGAAPHRPCRNQARTRYMTDPHPGRVTAWATATACCPACQVEPGTPCHLDGRAFPTGHIHPQRETEARETAA
ncbi:hypothetical protein GCM10010406_21520 [Streptomyces thermolineatus]|uniref:DNA-binding phage zinc finger domain-containing protein n=1 Tax=Streptomyces thermolineatus TaxID=44033 RepID=A0ABN3LIL5_9ACTN